MKIKKVLFAPGESAFFFDDQRAIKKGCVHDGFVYEGSPATEGFRRVREAGESCRSCSCWTDGRPRLRGLRRGPVFRRRRQDPVFKAETYIPELEKILRPRLEGTEVLPFAK